MNLRCGRVNGFISSKKRSLHSPPPQPPHQGGQERIMESKAKCCWGVWRTPLLDRVVAPPFCISFLQAATHFLSACMGQQVTRLWAFMTAWTQFQNEFVVPFPPSHKHSFACVAVLSWSSLVLKACRPRRPTPPSCSPQPCRCRKTSANFENHVIEYALGFFCRLFVGDGANAWTRLIGAQAERQQMEWSCKWGIFQTNVGS